MLSFFRRKKPDAGKPSEREYSIEELAAAIPGAQPQAPADPPAQGGAAEAAADAAPAAQNEARPAAAAVVDIPPVEAALVDATPVEAAPVEAPPAEARPVEARSAPAAFTQVAPPPAANPPAPAPTHAPDAGAPAPTAPAPTAPASAAPAQVEPPKPTPPTVVAPAALAPRETAPAAPDPVALTPVETAPIEYVDKPAAPAGKSGWRERLRNSAFARSFGGLFSRNPRLDDDLLDEIETALITADVGVTATTALVENLRKRMKSREFADANALLSALRADLIGMLQPVAKPLAIDTSAKPFVVLTVGVNGVGKTTTIGKLAKRFRDENRPLMLAAGDTFRAAAVAQLQAWGERNGVPVVAQGQNADAASVAFDALTAAKARGTQVLIADTAGRLHTQQGLMAELGKIRRVLAKVDATAPHEVLMVIDGTTGQNALSQLRQFHAAVGVTGLVVTKLDGTAKGGVVFALAREFGIPIRFAGIGERPEDLRVFDAEAFVDALLPEALGG
ncbi:signal recognition particle-docking protein FtsY [Lysobacter enzymogenes]|uniref:signal recognition particle-docking protein FtsY n=1 Tax=Lysobacter enzymogenes TaxID=69 RepID=UPI00099D04D0|nr:signal recognition particle-docking protein FtsY [Lysobacter enzymogenes]UZW62384.1 signal recognition particle-docking protein FtsY [Lysobacter enzymogenes]